MADETSSYSDPITDIITDALEAIIDTQSQDGLLKEVPIIGVPVKLYKAFNGIKDRIFLKKLSRFFEELSSIPEEGRTKFWSAFENDEQEKRRLGDQIIIYIDRHDNLDKSVLLAKAFKAYISQKITYLEFLDLAILIDSLKIHYLDVIAKTLVSVGAAYDSNTFCEIRRFENLSKVLPDMVSQGMLTSRNEIKMTQNRNRMVAKEVPTVKQEYRMTALSQNFIRYVVREVFEKAIPEQLRSIWESIINKSG